MDKVTREIAQTFLDMADGLETGMLGRRPRIALTGMGSEHGEGNAMEAAVRAAADGVDVVYIGSAEAPGIATEHVADDGEGHERMVGLLKSGEVDAAVTMHYPFPIGVSTVGRVITPARGREMFVATTTGTSSADRVESMVLNAVYGIACAKAAGVGDPSVGILNIDGARQVEIALRQLADGGYPIRFAESARADGGCVLRGNDVLQGTPDVLVCDSLTGNVVTKMLSSFSTGGSFEAAGFGYGPGIGRGCDELVLIVSRASGAPVVANALRFAAQLVRGRALDVARAEIARADAAGLKAVLEARRAPAAPVSGREGVAPPAGEPVPAAIPGIDVMDLEDAVHALWRAGIYAESGMGCTGPIVLTSEANLMRSRALLREAGYIA